MTSTLITCNHHKRFDSILNSFLNQPGLPFSDVLDSRVIQQAFIDRDGLFADEEIYSTAVVLWAFLAQVLRDGKGAACAAAVADVAAFMHQAGQTAPCGDTGDFCRARAKLNLASLRQLVCHVGDQLQTKAKAPWLWYGRHAKLVDGFTFTMPDTPANQALYPQLTTQKPGVGHPIARACVILSLATAAVCDIQIGPYQGKQTGESALLREMLDRFKRDDVVVFDRFYGSYMMRALLTHRSVDVCTRLHHRRHGDLAKAQKLGEGDYLVTWKRPKRPDWMSEEQYHQIPITLTLRQVQIEIINEDRCAETLNIVTTLIDPKKYPKEAIAELYGYRWNAELDIRDIKQTLNLDHVRCKSPGMVQREVTVTLLAYNLIRQVIATAAAVHEKQPRELGFTLACQTVLSAWVLLGTGRCVDAKSLIDAALSRIATNQVGKRPGRREPRVVKQRAKPYKLMQESRATLKAKRQNKQVAVP